MTQRRARRMRLSSALLKSGSASAVMVHAPGFVTLVSQGLKVKVGRTTPGKFKNNSASFFFFLSGLFVLQREKKKKHLLSASDRQLSILLVHALRVVSE